MPAISGGGTLFQNSVYVGLNLESILYGIELVLYFQTMRTLLDHRGARRKSDLLYAIFSSAMLLLTTIWVSAHVIFCQQMWVINADFPGGPNAFWGTNITVWYMELGLSSLVVLQLMTDALMIYRCWAVWDSYRVIIIPSILWVATLALGVRMSWNSTASGGFYYREDVVRIGMAYFSTSVFLTAMVTCAICFRVLWHARTVRKHLPREYASPYLAVAVLIVESVLPYTLSGIAWVASLATGSQTMGAFAYVYALMMCVSPQMLILRVATGAAWKRDTVMRRPHSTVIFSPQRDTAVSQSVSKDSEGGTQGWSRESSDNAV